MRQFDVSGCTAFVTGSARGLGAAMVEGLLKAGATKVYAGVRGDPSQSRWAGRDGVVPVLMSIDNPPQVQAVADRAGDISLLVNVAGVELRSPLLSESNLDNARREMEINYFGPLTVCRAFAPILRRNRGALVNTLSAAALANMPAVGSYSASKSAARSMTQGLRGELGVDDVPVYGVFPGPFDTDMAVGYTGHKYPPSMFAEAVIKALAEGAPGDIFPDPESQHLAGLMLNDFYELERVCGAMLPSPDFGREGRGDAQGH